MQPKTFNIRQMTPCQDGQDERPPPGEILPINLRRKSLQIKCQLHDQRPKPLQEKKPAEQCCIRYWHLLQQAVCLRWSAGRALSHHPNIG